MANIIGRVQKLGKQNRNQPDMNTNLLTVSFLINFFHNTDDKNIDMTLNSSSTNTMSSNTTSDVHEKPAETIEKKSPNNSKIIKIQLQTLMLMMILNYLKYQEKNHSVTSLYDKAFIGKTPTHK